MDTARGSVPMNVCGPSSWQVEAGGSGVQGHALAHSESEVNLFKKEVEKEEEGEEEERQWYSVSLEALWKKKLSEDTE